MINRQKLLRMAPTLGRYVLAVLAVVCTLALRLVIDPIVSDRAPYMFFFINIVLVKRLWGRGPGLLSTLLGGVAAWYFILEPRFSFSIASHADVFNLGAYFVVGTGISFLGEVSEHLTSSVSWQGKSIKRRFFRQTVVLGCAVAVLAGMLLLLLHEFRRKQAAQQWVAHTYRVLSSSESLVSAVKDAESAERGFLLTGDESYLAPYNAAIAVVPKGLKDLRDLTADNPRQQERFVEIKKLAAERLSILGQATDLYRNSKVNAALAVVRSGQGKQFMEKLRSAIEMFRREEFNLLEGREAQAAIESSRERWVLGLGCGVLILLLVLASITIERETVRREEIVEDLRRHADLLEQAHDSLLTFPFGGAIGYWSRGAETLFGYTREEAVGRLAHELLQTSHPYGMARIDALLERDGRWQGELTQITKDGRKLTVESQWTLAVDDRGNKTVLEANRDITQRKQAEAANVLLATAIEQAEETVVVTDRDGKVQYVNPAFTRTTGYARHEVLGQNPRVLKSGLHDAEFYRKLWSALTEGRIWRGEFTNRRKDGSLYTEEATIAPVRATTGEITNYIAIKSDITERRKGEAALRESEIMLRFFVQHAPAAIAMLDREMRYLVVSKRWMTDFGLGDRDIRGLSHYAMFPEIPQRWKDVHQRCLAGAVDRCKEDPFPRPDGER